MAYSKTVREHQVEGGKIASIELVPEHYDKTIVFVPGAFTKFESWLKVYEPLMELGYKIIVAETREKNSSTLEKGAPFTIQTYARDIAKVIGDYNLESYILKGSSVGTSACFEFLGNPEYQQGIALPEKFFANSANSHYRGKIFPQWLLPLVRWVDEKILDNDSGLEKIVDPIIRPFAWLVGILSKQVDRTKEPEQYLRYYDQLKRLSLSKAAKATLMVNDIEAANVKRSLMNIKVPTVIFCSETDKMHTKSTAEQICRCIPDCNLKVFKSNKDTHSPMLAKVIDNEARGKSLEGILAE